MRKYLFLGLFLCSTPLRGWAQQDTIADQHLQEVVITAKLPLVEMTPGKTTFRMDESITQSNGNLYDVLSSLPGVMINSGGTILLNGQSGVKILIDGKPNYLSGEELINLLKSTAATITDKIDLITHPSARYDAEGSNGIIDIHTRKIKLRGMNLALNGNFNQGKRANGYGSTVLNFRKDKFNIYFNYSYYQGKQHIDMETDLSFNKVSERNQLSYRNRTNYSHTLRTGCDFYPTDRTLIGVSINTNLGHQNETAGMFTEIKKDQISGWTYTTNKNKWKNISAGVLLNQRLVKEGGEFDLSFDYFHYYHPEDQFIYSFKPDTLKGEMRGDVNLYPAQTNFTYPLNKYWKLQTGIKTSFVRIDNGSGYLRPIESEWQQDISLGSYFVYNENINAAYLQADLEYHHLKLTAGLRLEHACVKGNSGGNSLQNDSSFITNQVHLFPTLSCSYALSSDNTLQFSYGRRIIRPNYRDLNPFIYIFDDYTFEVGNTRLRPSFSDNVELGYVHRDWLQTVFFFSYTHDAITKSYQERENHQYYVTPENLTSYIQTGLRMNAANLSLTNWWTINLTIIGMYNNYHWIDKGEKITNRRFTPMVHFTNLLTFGSIWSVEVSANYNGKMAYGQATLHPFSEVNLGARMKIFRGKGAIGIFVKDLFNTNFQKINLLVSEKRAWIVERENKRMIGISFSYRFQKGSKMKERKQKNSIEEMKRVNL